MSAGLEVISPGLMTSVQDRGRFGYQALGISVSGALDTDSFDIANALQILRRTPRRHTKVQSER